MRFQYRNFLLLGVAALSGCQMFGPQQSAYPTTPPLTKAAASAPAGAMASTSVPLKVPADAQVLSQGDYPPPGFSVPNQPGTIEVVDLDGDTTIAVASTSVTGTEVNKTMSVTDVPNMSAALNKTHKYKIVFVPLKPGTAP